MTELLDADLVLQGGGVKGIALVGAATELMAKYRFRRVAGTSAGAIVAALIAAGYTAPELAEAMADLEYRKVPDGGPLPHVSPVLSLLHSNGLYKGDYILEWIRDKLAAKEVDTFASLPLRDDESSDDYLSDDRKYPLVVTATDVTRGIGLRLPWDYRDAFGVDPAAQEVATAVRMSMSIPLFFRPMSMKVESSTIARWNVPAGTPCTIVDGGVLSNFPLQLFDRQDGKRPRWPTFGVGIIPDLPGADSTLFPGHSLDFPGPLGLGVDVMMSAAFGHDQSYLALPKNADRVMHVDTRDVGIVEFDINKQARERLYANGQKTAREFLDSFNWDTYRDRYYPE